MGGGGCVDRCECRVKGSSTATARVVYASGAHTDCAMPWLAPSLVAVERTACVEGSSVLRPSAFGLLRVSEPPLRNGFFRRHCTSIAKGTWIGQPSARVASEAWCVWRAEKIK